MTSALFDTPHLTQEDLLLSTRGTHYLEKLQGVKCWRLGVKIWGEDVRLGAHSPFSSRALSLGCHQPSTPGTFSSSLLLVWLPQIQNRVYFRHAQEWSYSSTQENEIKRGLLLGRKAMTNLDSILKSRDITLPAKVCLVKALVFPVVMYECESWIITKAEHQRIDASELWCWRRLLRVLWTTRRPDKSILKEISSEYSMKGLMLKLKLQYFGHLM